MDSLKNKLRAMSEGKLDLPPIMTTLGMKLDKAGEGKAVLSMKVDKRFHNPMGTLHGGIITDIADASMGVAVMTTLGEEETFTTLEVNMNFLRPVFEGEIVSEAEVLHRGKTIAVVQSVVTSNNGESKQVARGTATQFILRPK